MLERIKGGPPIRRHVSNERKMLLEGAHLAMVQWQYGLTREDQSDIMTDILERRYMFLYETAKKRRIHALE